MNTKLHTLEFLSTQISQAFNRPLGTRMHSIRILNDTVAKDYTIRFDNESWAEAVTASEDKTLTFDPPINFTAFEITIPVTSGGGTAVVIYST